MLLCGAGAVLVSGVAQAQTAAPPPPESRTDSTTPPIAETPPAAVQAVAAAPTLRFWDGGDSARHGNNAIDGGSGTWSVTAPNWTDAGGAINGPMNPVPAFAVFQGTAGTVTIDDSQGVPAISSMLFNTNGYRLTGGQLRLDGGAFTSIRTGDGLTARIDSELTGDSGLLYNALGTLILGGQNSYTGGTRVDGGTLIGDTRSIRGNLDNGGHVVFDQAFDDTFHGGVSGLASIWGLMTKRGAGNLTLAAGSQLDWRVEQGGLIARGEGFGGNIDVSSGARLTLSSGDVAGVTSTYRYALSGAGRFDVAGKGLLVLTANSGGFTGHTGVQGAALRVEGTLGGTLQVGDGGRLGGTGTAGDVVVGNGGHLIGTPGEFLRMSSLVLGPGAIIDARLGNLATPQLFVVEGDLTLDGTINIAGTGPIGAGVYRLISFGGKLVNNRLSIGSLPTGQERSLISITTTNPWGVDLISEIGGMPMQFWDGSDPTRFNDGRIEGGPGVWRSNLTGWTDRTGKKNQAYVGTGFSVFDGRGGQVIIDGVVQTGGMQFAVNGYALSGSGLRLAGNGERTIIRVGDGSQWASSMTAEISAPISGTGRLVKNDAGTLILSGVNSYTGATEVEEGTLIGDTRSIRNTLLNGATVVFDQRANGVFADKVLGLRGNAGKMIKRGSGVLTLARESRLDWTVEEGRLVAQADRYFSDVTTLTGSGELALGVTTGAVDFDTEFRGNGRLTKTGAGKLVLTEHSRYFEGTTRIAGGELVVDHTLGGHVIVEANTTLSGEGRMGSVFVARGGTIAPRPSAARPAWSPVTSLRIDGDITFQPGARFEVDVDPASPFGFADNLYVRGVARLAGSVFHVGTGGNYAPSSAYTILTAFGGIEGRFDGVSSSMAFLTPRLEYTTRTVQLVLDRNDVRFSDVAASANQRAVGAALQTMVAGPLYDAVIDADAAEARAAFDSISGDLHASLRTALVEDSRLTRGAALSRLGAPAGAPGISAWGEAIGAWGHYASDGNAARLERSAAGGLAGIEAQLPESDVRLGVFGGYHHSDLRGAGDADVDSYQTGLYAGARFGGLALRGGVAIGWQDVATRREISGVGLEEQVRARYGATTAQAFGELAWRVALGSASLEPFAGLAHVALDVEQGRERGDAAALALAHDSMSTNYATLGVRGETLLSGAVSLRGSAGWQHVFGDRLPMVAMTVDGARFESVGVAIAQDGLVGDLGLVARLGDRLEFNLNYRGALSKRNRDHSASGGLTFRF